MQNENIFRQKVVEILQKNESLSCQVPLGKITSIIYVSDSSGTKAVLHEKLDGGLWLLF